MVSVLLFQGGPEYRQRRASIAGQQTFMDRLVMLVKMVARESGNRKKKVRAISLKDLFILNLILTSLC